MGRAVNLSPLGLYNWDQTIFDLMQIPEELDRNTLIDNLLAETAELEVLYPNPIVFKNLLGVWSAKQIDIWNRLYATTQYEYNPIENYNRYETGSDNGTGRTTHSGTDTDTETVTTSGKDTLDMTRRDGGTESRTTNTVVDQGGSDTESTTFLTEQGGSDTTTVSDTKGHWVAGFDAQTVTSDPDGLFKQTRDQDNSETQVQYGKSEEGESTKTIEYGKTESGESTEATTFGKTETNKDETTYGKTVNRQGSVTHGEQIATVNEGEHELHAHGNIGVTTTQKLIKEQRSIDLFNLYDIIIEDFKMRFCILVY